MVFNLKEEENKMKVVSKTEEMMTIFFNEENQANNRVSMGLIKLKPGQKIQMKDFLVMNRMNILM